MGMVDKVNYYKEMILHPTMVATDQSRQFLGIMLRQAKSMVGEGGSDRLGGITHERWYDENGDFLGTASKILLYSQGNHQSKRIVAFTTPDGIQRMEFRHATQEDWDKIAASRKRRGL